MLPENLVTGRTAKLPGDYKQQATPARKQPTRGRMNKTEALYSMELEAQKRVGAIRDWKFEAVKLRLANKTWLTPDFLVIHNDGTVEFIETKGFLRDDASVKFKIAREMYPFFRWKMLRRKAGDWEEMLR